MSHLSHLVMSQQHVVCALQLQLSFVKFLKIDNVTEVPSDHSHPESHLPQQILLKVVILDQSPPPKLSNLVIQSVFLSSDQSLGLLSVHLLEVFFMLK